MSHETTIDLVQVHVPWPVLLVVAVAVRHARQREEAGVGDRELGRALLVLERGERHERLDGRARRVLAAQRPVVERLVGRVVERVPVLRVDAVDEEVRVEAGLGHQRQHLARLRVDRDQRAAIVLERLLGDLLQLEVERDHEVVARDAARCATSERMARPPASISTCSRAGDAVQLLLVGALDAELADVVGALVVGREALRRRCASRRRR